MVIYIITKKIMSKNCPICFSDTKITLSDYALYTRIPGRRKTILKKVHYHQCKICEHKELTKESIKMIQSLTNHYLTKYEDEPGESEEITSSVSFSTMKKKLSEIYNRGLELVKQK